MLKVTKKNASGIPEVNDTGPGRIYAMAPIRSDGFKIWNTGSGLWTLALLLSCFLSSNLARAEPEPGPFYPDSFASDPESLHLLTRLRQLTQLGKEINEQEREITDEAMAIERALEAKTGLGMPYYSQREYSEEDGIEPLPVPSAVHAATRPDKRGSYMALCHFKICNMGRKRQLQMSQVRTKLPSLNSWVSLGTRSSSTLLRLPSS